MTKHRFAKRLACASVIAASCARPRRRSRLNRPARGSHAESRKADQCGRRVVGRAHCDATARWDPGKRVATHQITSEPRRLPPPNGLCNLETGPETFQLITSSDSQAAELKRLVGKEISVKVDEISCAQDAGQMTEAVVTRWSVVRR